MRAEQQAAAGAHRAPGSGCEIDAVSAWLQPLVFALVLNRSAFEDACWLESDWRRLTSLGCSVLISSSPAQGLPMTTRRSMSPSMKLTSTSCPRARDEVATQIAPATRARVPDTSLARVPSAVGAFSQWPLRRPHCR